MHSEVAIMAPADKPQQEASTSAAKVAQEANKGEEDAKKTLPQLGALEEDDEFEEVRPDNPSSSSKGFTVCTYSTEY